MEAETNFMTPERAHFLIEEFQRQFPTLKLSETEIEKMKKIMYQTPVLTSSRFDEEPAGKLKLDYASLEEDSREIRLYLTRIARNANAGSIKMNLGKWVAECTLDLMGFRSSTIISRRSRRDPILRGYMLQAEQRGNPLSVLFNYVQHDFDPTPKGNSYTRIERPVLIIPGLNREERENVETFEIEQGRVHLSPPRGISRRLTYKEYLKSMGN